MIHVNVHEPLEIINLLRTAAKIEVSNFTPGDYCIGNIAIERKTLSDFLQSLVQKRLQEQLQRLKSCYQVCFLIVEVFDLRYFHNIQAIYGALLSIMLEMNVRIIFTHTKEQTAAVILLLAGYHNSSNQEMPLQHQPKKTTLQQQQIQMLRSIPQVGRKRARLLLQRFGSIQAIFKAQERELLAVSGIGAETIESMRRIWKGDRKE